eukprot:2554380-Prymnesium_polylepis.1
MCTWPTPTPPIIGGRVRCCSSRSHDLCALDLAQLLTLPTQSSQSSHACRERARTLQLPAASSSRAEHVHGATG